jgi:putative chitinase
MEQYRVVDPTGANVRSTAAIGDNVIRKMNQGDVFSGERSLSEYPGFVKVIAPGPQGFVFLHLVETVGGNLEPEHILPSQHDAFCIAVTVAARDFGPERNYLMAAAYCGSKNLTDVGTATSEKVGPFQITLEDWRKGIALADSKGIKDLTEADRYRWYRQPVAAALLAADCGRQLTTSLGQDATFIELYFAQLFGDGADIVLKGDRTLTGAKAAANLAPKTSYGAAFKADETTSVNAVLNGLEQGLIGGLAEARIVIDRQPPDIRYFRAQEIAAPWMAVALAEYAQNVEETPDPSTNNERIVLYHEAAGVAAKTDETPWCASFVTYCMKQSGDPKIAASVPDRPAWAPNWRTWGNPVPPGNEPIGTVVCWQPGGDATAHVGFLFANEVDGYIQLLGGNQGAIQPGGPDALNIKKFSVEHITARRWFGPLPGAAGDGGAAAGAGNGLGAGVALDAGPLLVSPDQFKSIFPECPNPVIWAAAVSAAWLHFGIKTRQAKAGFLGITGSETQYRSVMRENTMYTAEQAAKFWLSCRAPNGEPTAECKAKVNAGPVAFANWIYAGVNHNGNEASGDGYKFRGGGIIQLTGRGNYTAFSQAIGLPPLLDNTDLILDPMISATAAGWFMQQRGMIAGLDTDDEAVYLALANAKVGAAPNTNADERRRNFRQAALNILPP